MNQVILIGNLTKDPELRYTQNQTPMCRFTIAVNDRRKNPNTGEYEDSPSFIPVIVWGRKAENCDKFLTKGRKVGISGRIQTGSYTNKEGQKVYTTDVIANGVEFLSQQEQRPMQQEQMSFGQDNGYVTRQQYERERSHPEYQGHGELPNGFEQMAAQEHVPF